MEEGDESLTMLKQTSRRSNGDTSTNEGSCSADFRVLESARKGVYCFAGSPKYTERGGEASHGAKLARDSKMVS